MSKCLTCKYEPDWSEWSDEGEYKRKTGRCRCAYKIKLPKATPRVCTLRVVSLTVFADGSGLPKSCDAYEPKDE